MTTIEQLPELVQGFAGTVARSVVSLGRDDRGTGIVVAPGLVLTNAHNLRNRTIQVRFSDGRVVQGAVHAVDPDGDLAVLSVPDATDVAVWTDATPPLGAAVFGVSLSAEGPRVSFGTVSAVARTFTGPRGRTITGSIEHTAPLARGASGGPVVDTAGRVVAVNTHRLGDGFYLARPYDETLRARIAALVAGSSIERRKLGVALSDIETSAQLRRAVGLPARDGLLVRGVAADGPGAAAGLREGDLLVGIDGRAITSLRVLEDVLTASQEANAPTVTISIVRGTDEQSVIVRFTPEPEA